MAQFSIAQVNTANQMALLGNKKKDNTKLDIDAFLQLMAAQIQNQDVLGSGGGSGSSNEDYVGQMLQMTLIQSISDMMNMSMTSYATSMIGKEVSIADTSDFSGVTEVKGIVTGVTLYGDDPMVQVNGKEYSLSQVMVIGAPKTEEAPKEEEAPEENEPVENDPPKTEGSVENDPPKTEEV